MPFDILSYTISEILSLISEKLKTSRYRKDAVYNIVVTELVFGG